MTTDEPISLETPVRLMRKMSHDMRGPLSTLTITSDLFMQGAYGEVTPKQARAVDRIQRNSYRLLALLEDLMAYVKAEAGQFALMTETFPPNEVLNGVQQEIAQYVAQHDSQRPVHLALCEHIPPRLTGDPVAVRRIILALLWNAVAFAASGDIWIESCWTDAERWTVSVRDSGPGISPGDQPHIFEPFWRGDQRPQVPTSGFGLGLSMARALARLMGGDVRLEQSSPSGSTFLAALPLPTVSAVSPAANGSTTSTPPAASPPSTPPPTSPSPTP
ncbi:MAG: HAMP domain-containing histidine kinase [Chloroflexi bacterium]|nr:HAMP domain-containing histidine kinase [Chloroflexota bacterium]